MANAHSTVAALNTLEPKRRDAILEAARKLQTLSDALVSHSHCASTGAYEDLESAIEIVLSVARRQSDLSGMIVQALDGGSTVSTQDLISEVHNG